ncbi:MAG: serine/threonine-protein kinase [Myxococcota bacterium]
MNRLPTQGEVFAGAYRVDKQLGSGGFSHVYRATQLDLDRPVALKIMAPPGIDVLSESKQQALFTKLATRFEREAKLVSKLRSPHTVSVYAFGTDERTGLLYMAMEFVDGLDLLELVQRDGPLSGARVIKVLRQVLHSLGEAHQLGMLHRDIKPQNIMIFEHLGEGDQVKLLDFGIAKVIGDATDALQTQLTGDGSFVGTPRYMSPEHLRENNLTAAADIYSLGLVAIELLTGVHAVPGNSNVQIITRQLDNASISLDSSSGVPEPLRRIINRMVHKDCSVRYADAATIIAELRDAQWAIENHGVGVALDALFDGIHVADTSPSGAAPFEITSRDQTPPYSSHDGADTHPQERAEWRRPGHDTTPQQIPSRGISEVSDPSLDMAPSSSDASSMQPISGGTDAMKLKLFLVLAGVFVSSLLLVAIVAMLRDSGPPQGAVKPELVREGVSDAQTKILEARISALDALPAALESRRGDRKAKQADAEKAFVSGIDACRAEELLACEMLMRQVATLDPSNKDALRLQTWASLRSSGAEVSFPRLDIDRELDTDPSDEERTVDALASPEDMTPDMPPTSDASSAKRIEPPLQ